VTELIKLLSRFKSLKFFFNFIKSELRSLSVEGFIELPKFKKNDKEIVPGRYLSSTDSVDKTEFENFVLHPKESNCKDIKTLITIKSATDHFGKNYVRLF
jgi:hypothetical protein